VGLRADGNRVEVDLVRPAGDFPSVVASPTFAVVPEAVGRDAGALDDDGFVGSGGYVIAEASDTGLRLERNEHYWAGPPAISTVHLVGDLGGRSAVQAFEAGELDYAGIGEFDASWIRYDPDLGSHLRAVPAFSTEYLGFDTTRPPFDDVRIRRAFAQAVDWSRLVRLAGTAGVTPATSMVPPGIPGRSERSFLPTHDPDAARALLADAGFPEGRGFPTVTYLSGGGTVDAGFVADVQRELGIEVRYEVMDFDTYFARLEDEPPAIWSLSWIADYPGANDFLGVLLHSQSSNNYGGWSDAEFDAAIADAGETTDPAAARAAYDRAESILQSDVPVIPLAHSPGWALAADGLLGATENGLGSLRLAGLAWAE
jgi:oligopeptide transport system substrate-binding protein